MTTQERGKCARPVHVADGQMAPCGQPARWLVALNDRAWALCDDHKQRIEVTSGEIPTFSAQPI